LDGGIGSHVGAKSIHVCAIRNDGELVQREVVTAGEIVSERGGYDGYRRGSCQLPTLESLRNKREVVVLVLVECALRRRRVDLEDQGKAE
jgi:hypothetical protein